MTRPATQAEITLQALLDLWRELPQLFGSSWADAYPRLEALIPRLREAMTSAEQSMLLSEIVLLFSEYPAVAKALNRAIQRLGGSTVRVMRGESGVKGIDNSVLEFSAATQKLQQCINPPSETRHTDITAPERLAINKRAPITVRLTCKPELGSIFAQPLDLPPVQEVEVCLRALGDEVEIGMPFMRRLSIEPGQDSEPAVFFVWGRKAGTVNLAVDFSAAGQWLGSQQLTIEITATAQESEQHASTPLTFGGPYTPPPDLDIRIMTQMSNGGILLSYVLHSPNGVAGYQYYELKEQQFIPSYASAQAYQQRWMDTLEALNQGRDIGKFMLKTSVEDKLKSMGRLLYEELFPPGLRAAYRQFRDKVKTIQIISDEPWIPWELVRPYDASDLDHIIDDDFLGIRFQLTRWLAGPMGGGSKIQLRQLACVEASSVPGLSKLAYALQERTYLQGFAAAHRITDASPAPANTANIVGLLETGGTGLWHFATHGNIDLLHANESVVILADGGALHASDINGSRQLRIAVDRPLIFLNACRVGQQGWSLTQLGGWAATFVARCRCGAFVGPLWSVDDQVAYEFARFFYEALGEGKTLGQAAQIARCKARDLAPENPTWLAYSIYAHPNARVAFSQPSPNTGARRSGVMRGG